MNLNCLFIIFFFCIMMRFRSKNALLACHCFGALVSVFMQVSNLDGSLAIMLKCNNLYELSHVVTVWDYISKYWHSCIEVPSITDRCYRLAMSTPPNNERSPWKWLKQKFRSVFSCSRSPSRNLEVRSTSTNVPSINFPSDGPRILTDRTGTG